MVSMTEINGELGSALTVVALRKLTVNGYVYIRDVPDSFDYLDFFSAFGELMPQYDGELVWDLKPEPGMDDIYHSRNTRALVPHTEAYEYPGRPPRYIGLWCVTQAKGTGGETTLADGHEWQKIFTKEEYQLLFELDCEWRSSDGLARENIQLAARHPVLELDADGRVIMRYSYNNMVVADDPFLCNLVESGAAFFAAEHEAVNIEKNGLLLWDNWRMLHSRTAFTDMGRHLRRVMIR